MEHKPRKAGLQNDREKAPQPALLVLRFPVQSTAYKGTTKQTSKVRAQEYERRLIYQLEHGRDPFLRSPFIKDLLPRYLSWLEVNNKSAPHIARSKQAIGDAPSAKGFYETRNEQGEFLETENSLICFRPRIVTKEVRKEKRIGVLHVISPWK